VLSVEVTGEDETEDDLRRKAGWYLAHGVQVVWLVLPATFEVVVVRADSDRRFSLGDSLPAEPALPGLAPAVAQFFIQIRR
jgi:Uma2 family endonuclease